MTERLCYVLTAQQRDYQWVCCVFDTEADALAGQARSEAASPRTSYTLDVVPFHSQTDTMPG